jgi:hypothetical protein
MHTLNNATPATLKTVHCPYCTKETTIDKPKTYAPIYAYCGKCTKKFIVERLAHCIQVLTIEGAPCSSDPDCREIEMGASDEQ